MEEHKELKKLVYASLEWRNSKGQYPTASELFHEIKSADKTIASKGFKSFARLINIFPQVDAMSYKRGFPRKYVLKDLKP